MKKSPTNPVRFNVSDSQVLGDLLNQIPQDEQINSVYTDGAYDTKHLIPIPHLLQSHKLHFDHIKNIKT